MMRPIAPVVILLTFLTPVAHVNAQTAPTANHQQLMWYADDDGQPLAVQTKSDWAKRRAQILDGMQEAMGRLPDRDDPPAFDMQTVSESQGDGYRRLTISFVAEGTDRIPADLYIPNSADGVAQLRPAVVALHPTGALGKRIVAGEGPLANRQYAVELAQRGYVVIAPDYPSFGDYSAYDFKNDGYVSGTMKGIVNHMRCVDLLTSEVNSVDPDRIGVIGHSLGGHNAMFLGVFDQRVKVIVSSCGWTPFHDYYDGNITGWTSDRYMPLLKTKFELKPDKVPFDFYEVVAALAPRNFFSSSPLDDSNFAVAGVRKAIPKAKEVYDLFEAGQNLKVVYPHSEHDFPTETRERAYEFIDQALQHQPSTTLNFAAELPRFQPLEPDAALKAFEVAEGFEIQQTAAEPLITDPVAMSFDEQGRLYVVEMKDYSEQEHDQLGQVRLLEDTNHDGTFDKATVFADGLSWPTAIICSQGGVFVGAAPEILFLRDTDGDLKADQRDVVFTGFERSNIQGLLNSFRWGLDNRIHGATSSSGGRVKRPNAADSAAVNLRGRDFSFDPLKLDLRAEAGGAQHGLSFADFGRKFVCSNSDHAQYVIYDDKYLTNTPNLVAPPSRVSIADDGGQAPVFRNSPIEPWRIVRTRLRVSGTVKGLVEGGGKPAGYFTGATGITIFRGDGWGADEQGTAFIGDVGSNIVHRKQLIPNGVSYVASRIDAQSEFVRSDDTWFRPVQFANAPDGCLHILDMYREVIEHPQSLPPEIKQHLDLTSGRDRGRLYRVSKQGHTVRTNVDLRNKTAAELIALLDHPNSWHRETAARLIYEQSAEFNDLQSLLSQHAANGQLPQGRVHALYLLGSLNLLTNEIALGAIRDSSADVVEHALKLSQPFASQYPDGFPVTAELVQQPRVALQLAFSAAFLPEPQRLETVTKILQDSDLSRDRWIRTAALSSLPTGAGHVFSQLASNPKTDAAAITSLVQLIARQNQANDIAIVVEELGNVNQTRPDQAAVLVKSLLAERSELSPKLADVVTEILDRSRTTALSTEQTVAQRLSAIESLGMGNFDSEQAILGQLINQQQPAQIQSAALGVLGGFSSEAAPLILEHWNSFSPSLRLQAESILFSRPQSIAALFDWLEDKRIQASQISSAQLNVVAKSKDTQLKQRAVSLLQQTTSKVDVALMQKYRTALEQPGRISDGRNVFRKSCATCHRLENHGYELGPNLATIKNRGAESILLNVLDPNREVNPQYVTYAILTTSGRTFSGLIQNETATNVTLVRAENKADTILRSDIEELTSTGVSLMPEDLHKAVSPEQLSDVVAYLLSIE